MASDEVPIRPASQDEAAVLRVPGVNMLVDSGTRGTFPSAVAAVDTFIRHSWRSHGLTVRERRMMAFVSDITDKPEWERKVFDDDIVEKWRAEASQTPEALDGDVILSEEMFDFCIKELRDKAEIFKKTGLVNIFDGDLSIAKSDVAVSDSLRNALCDGIKPLEDVPERLKDWHPRSNNLVLDLVHPSLFPVAYGLTRYLNEKVPLDKCLEYIGRGTTMDPFTPPRTSYERPSEWGSFQWLPTDVKPTDKGAKLQGYINNLHPKKHADLYEVLEAIVGATIPMWEETLSGFYDRRRIIIKSSGEADWHYTALFRLPHKEDGPDAWYDPNADVYCAEDGTPYEGEEDPDEYEDWQWEDPYDTWKEENRILKQREPKAYTPQAELAAGKKKVDLGGEKYPEGLQVIFKLANIHLTPEKPEYGGGSWHVEGGLNEGICASAIYYFDQDNITESRLAFRQAVDAEEMTMVPEQNLHEAYERHMGVEQHGPPIQELGKALTREGRLLAFPNCVQHRVEPFSLEDRSRPGYRKILAMFLIDPERRVLSTSNVPPQRRDWWAEELRRKGVLGELPAEIREHTIDMVDFPISWEKAVEMREKLMDERSFGDQVVSEKMMEETFFFCEH